MKTFKEHAFSQKLGYVCEIKTNFTDADFWLERRNSIENVGKPVTEFNKENIGIKVNRTDILDSKYLYYVMLHLYNQGYWKNVATGTLKLVNITVKDVQKIQLG